MTKLKTPIWEQGVLCPPLVPGQPPSGTLSVLINGPPHEGRPPEDEPALGGSRLALSFSPRPAFSRYPAGGSWWSHQVVIDLSALRPGDAHVVQVYQRNTSILNVSAALTCIFFASDDCFDSRKS